MSPHHSFKVLSYHRREPRIFKQFRTTDLTYHSSKTKVSTMLLYFQYNTWTIQINNIIYVLIIKENNNVSTLAIFLKHLWICSIYTNWWSSIDYRVSCVLNVIRTRKGNESTEKLLRIVRGEKCQFYIYSITFTFL